jgi:hypothetical protein
MNKTHMSTAEFIKTLEWAALSARQKFWLQTYIASDDPILAVQNAYQNVAEKNIRAFSYKIIKQRKIHAALNRYFNRSEKDIYLAQLERDIARTKGAAKIELQLRFAELKFGSKPAQKTTKRKKS